MRNWCFFLVVVVHIVVLSLLFVGKEPETPQHRLPSPEAEPPSQQQRQQRQERQEFVPETASPARQKSEKFSPGMFQHNTRPLPAEVKTLDCSNTGILIDWSAKQILWEKDVNKSVPIASLTKMMTTLLLIEDVERLPELTLESVFKVTPEASKVGGSQVYMDSRESFTLETILKCIAIFSANDAAYLAAQILGGGDSQAFVSRMNERARQLGFGHFIFHNPHGLTEPGGKDNSGNAFEIACLAGKLLGYPDVVKHSSTWVTYIRQDTGKPFQLANRNRLVTDLRGVNGMKTGYTSRAGYCIAATCERDGRILIAVATGCPTSAARNRFVTALLEWGYKQP